MEIETQAIVDYFVTLGFEVVPIEDGLTALSFEEDPDGEYALITDEDGSLPKSLENPLMLAFYSAQGTFLWSTGFKSAAQFKVVWSQGETFAEKLEAAKHHREEIMDPWLRMQV